MKLTLSDKFNILTQILFQHVASIFSGDKQISILLPKANLRVKLDAFSSDLGDLFQTFVLEQFKFDVEMSPDLIIDAGANIGCSTIWFLLSYPKAKVVGIEPFESNFQKMAANVSGFNNAVAINSAIWNKKVNLKIKNSNERRNRMQVVESKRRINGTFESVTIDELIKKEKNILVKLDIEGAEENLFNEKYKWLDRVSYIIIEFHEWRKKGSSNNFYKATKGRGYKEFKRGELLLYVK